jgi:hypothetical protein
MRHYSVSRLATLFFSPDSKLRVRRTNLDMFASQSWEFYPEHYEVRRFAKINRRRPGFGSERIVRHSCFLQSREQSPHAIAEALQFKSFQAGCARGFYHSARLDTSRQLISSH